MTPLSFILLQMTVAAIDFAVTFGVAAGLGVDILPARFCGAVVAFTAIVYTLNRLHKPGQPGSFLPISIGAVTTLVSYGLFALLLTRNPMLQWPITFLAASLAAFIFGSAGCCRALKRRKSSL